jgi:hypothetical protein
MRDPQTAEPIDEEPEVYPDWPNDPDAGEDLELDDDPNSKPRPKNLWVTGASRTEPEGQQRAETMPGSRVAYFSS